MELDDKSNEKQTEKKKLKKYKFWQLFVLLPFGIALLSIVLFFIVAISPAVAVIAVFYFVFDAIKSSNYNRHQLDYKLNTDVNHLKFLAHMKKKENEEKE